MQCLEKKEKKMKKSLQHDAKVTDSDSNFFYLRTTFHLSSLNSASCAYCTAELIMCKPDG